MEFDKSRIYTSLNADELKQGDKVITARCMADLKIWVEADAEPNIIELIQDETNTDRFTCKGHGSKKIYDSPLAYLVERAENCTNCGASPCGYRANHDIEDNKINKCPLWFQPKTEQKAEKHYRPFRDTDELVKVWGEKIGATSYWGKGADLVMPHIWVRSKFNKDHKGVLINNYFGEYVELGTVQCFLERLFGEYTFLDGSPCGVEE